MPRLAIVMVLAGMGCGKSTSQTEPIAPVVNTASEDSTVNSAEPNAPELVNMDTLIGTWMYARDPENKIGFEPIYEGSTYTFGENGAYKVQLARTTFALEGQASARDVEADRLVVDVDFGNGMTTQYRVTMRGEDALVMAEGDEEPPASIRYLERQ